MDRDSNRKFLKKTAIAIRSSGNLGTFSSYFPIALVLSIPLGFVAIWRKNQVLNNPELVATISKLDSVESKELHRLKKQDTLEGAAALFLVHKNSAYNAFAALAFWLIVGLGLTLIMWLT